MGKPIMVVGGGIVGLTAALEAAEAGREAILIEKEAFLGGRVAHMRHYFPKLCPPSCGLEINFKRLKANPRVTVITRATLEKVAGTPGDFTVTVRIAPRYVTPACTACGDCVPACPAGAMKAADPVAYPARFSIERAKCSKDCDACVKACKYAAIDLSEKEEVRAYNVGAVIAATGWKPYDAAKLNLGFGKFPNVVTNVMVEEAASAGALARPSDGRAPKTVAFAQCAGSRDENHLPYCSSVCCAATLKQSTYFEGAKVTVFYIDVRTMGRLEDFYNRVGPNVELIKGKAGKVEEDPETHDLLVTAEDVMGGKKITRRVEMLVLATGIAPQSEGLPAEFARGEFGFLESGAGLVAAGCAQRPGEVSASTESATAAVLKAMRWAK